MISPKVTTPAVEIITAQYEGRILSKQMGRHSIAKALATNKVLKRRWCFAKIGEITEAYLFSSSVPFLILSSSWRSLMERKPTVRPDIAPANNIKKMDEPK